MLMLFSVALSYKFTLSVLLVRELEVVRRCHRLDSDCKWRLRLVSMFAGVHVRSRTLTVADMSVCRAKVNLVLRL